MRTDPHAADPFAETRPPSVWPSTLRPGEARLSSTFAESRFDPLAEERARAEAHAAVAFDVCHPGLALRAVLGVQVVLAIGTLVARGAAGWPAFGGTAFAGLLGTLLWLLPVCALKQPLRRLPAPARAGVALLLGALAALAGQAPGWWLQIVAPPDAAHVLGVALAGAGLAGLLWAWLDLRARIWAPVDARVRLAELQSRIRPHFLFNALNTALALVRHDPLRAEQVLQNLGDLFRAALADAGASISLDEELALARAYLAIEQVRFGHRLRLDWQVDTGVGRARVPPLMLQPLVENAVRHGVEPSARGAQVVVRAALQRGQVVVEVINTLPDEPALPGTEGHGMALHNVRERLRLLHDVAAHFETWRAEGQHHARVVIPL
ncbi:MAG: histidine kinase [Burkholderiaceae bacterium]|nr:histidine kinase [Burkholderiaceae bacterium]